MKTRREARVWVLGFVVDSLRFRAEPNGVAAGKYGLPEDLTKAGVRRVQQEMLALAERLERQQAKLGPKA